MKVMKLALLGTAALAAASISARADDLADLKAQIETLKAEVATMQAAPAAPVGAKLVTVSDEGTIVPPGVEFDGANTHSATATTINVLPSADMPASTSVQWSGNVRAAIQYHKVDESGTAAVDREDGHLKARGTLYAVGRTDTSVGEVGASIELITSPEFEATDSQPVKMDEAWGWWKMTPELTFAGGYNGSLAKISGYGMRALNDDYISRGKTAVDGGDLTQLRLSYESGPINFAFAIEQTDTGGMNDETTGLQSSDSPFGGAAEMKFKSDMFRAELAGFIRDIDTNGTTSGGDETSTQIGLGLGAKLSEMFDLSVAGSMFNNVNFSSNIKSDSVKHYGDGWNLSGAVVASLTDQVSTEAGIGYRHAEDDMTTLESDVTAFAGGVYWSPVSQIKTGVQASYVKTDNNGTYKDVDETKAAFVTWWNF